MLDYNIGLMQSNFFATSMVFKTPPRLMPTSPATRASSRSNLPKGVVVIDLSEIDETDQHRDRISFQQGALLGQEGSNTNQLQPTTNFSHEESKEPCTMDSSYTRFALAKKGRKEHRKGNQSIPLKPVHPQIYDVDEPTADISITSSGPPFRLQKMIIQPSINELQVKKMDRHANKPDRQLANNRLFQSLVTQSPLPFDRNEINCSMEGPYLKKIEHLSISVDDQVKQCRRRTRNKPRNQGQFYEQPDHIDFSDEQVKKRIKVAKYRYGISGCSTAIDEMVVKVNHRIHFGQHLATVQPYPTIPAQAYKHRIFVQCLKLQFKKRKFVYLE